jgi:glyoxylase-like metal-dependent hydrolase (beta-lactamase superfamily II)
MKLGEFKIDWLQGGVFRMDGGAMFGVVPRALWTRKYPVDEDDNTIELLNACMLIQTPAGNVVIETGFGNKISDKAKKIFRIGPDWDLPGSLDGLGLKREDIDYVILTHCDFDHAGGVTMNNADGVEELTLPNAKHIVQRAEWEDALNPNTRSANTYLKENFEILKNSDKLVVVEGDYEVMPGIRTELTGGHTRGHQVVWIESAGEHAVHMADLLPTHAHHNPLWVMAFDNYPLDAIDKKQELHKEAEAKNAWYLLYHDTQMKACKFGERGKVTDKVLE